MPKTLIFAKTDSHADDIVQIVREEFGEGNDFCRKITYAVDNPESVLSSFRNDYKFYMRFNGHNGIWPCDYVLLAI